MNPAWLALGTFALAALSERRDGSAGIPRGVHRGNTRTIATETAPIDMGPAFGYEPLLEKPQRRRRRRKSQNTSPLLLTGPMAPEKSSGLGNVMVQPLPQALEAAKLRFLKHPVTDIRTEGQGLIFTIDPRSTKLLMVPPVYLGWPVRIEDRV